MAEKEGLAKTVEATVVAEYPDVCNTPMGSSVVAVAYQIMAKLNNAVNTSATVNFNGQPAFHAESFLSTLTGNEPGTLGGLSSGVNLGFCHPTNWSLTVNTNSNGVVRHNDPFDMNSASPKGKGNTPGKANLIKVSQKATVDEEGNIVVEKEMAIEDSEGNLKVARTIEKFDAAGNRLDRQVFTLEADAASRGMGLPQAPELDLSPERIEVPRFPQTAPEPTPSPFEMPPPTPVPQPSAPAPLPPSIPPSPVEVPPAQPTHPTIVPETPAEQGWWDTAAPWVHGGLDVVGLIPGLGEFADGVNALIYLGEGEYGEAALAAAGMIPFAGWGATAGKWIKRIPGIEKVIGGIGKALGAAGQGVASLAKRAYSAVKSGAVRAARAGYAALKKAASAVWRGIMAGVRAIKRLGEKIWQGLKSVKEGVEARFKKLKERFKKKGKDAEGNDIDGKGKDGTLITPEEQARRKKLGEDPATKKFRPNEAETAVNLEKKTGLQLERSSNPKYDWVDSSGKTYDAVGNFPDQYFSDDFIGSITRHLKKEGLDHVVVDLTKFSSENIATVKNYLGLLSKSDFAKIITIP